MTAYEVFLYISLPRHEIIEILSGSLEKDLEIANKELEKYTREIHICLSDDSYYRSLAWHSYWDCVKNVLTAALLNNGVIPDMDIPKISEFCVMDSISDITKAGETILAKTKEYIKENKEINEGYNI